MSQDEATPPEWAAETADQSAPTPSPEVAAHHEAKALAAGERSRERVRRRQRVKETGVNPLSPEGLIPLLELMEAIDIKLDLLLEKESG